MKRPAGQWNLREILRGAAGAGAPRLVKPRPDLALGEPPSEIGASTSPADTQRFYAPCPNDQG